MITVLVILQPTPLPAVTRTIKFFRNVGRRFGIRFRCYDSDSEDSRLGP